MPYFPVTKVQERSKLTEDLEREESLKRYKRRKRSSKRALLKLYKKQAQAKSREKQQKMRSASWSQGDPW